MPRGAGQRGKKRGAYRKRAAPMRRFKSSIMRGAFNPSPVFTESFQLTRNGNPVFLQVNSGFLLTVSIDQCPQIAQYQTLYTKYKILSAKWMLLPRFSAGSSDQNAVNYNNGAGQPWVTDARIVYSIQDSPNQVAPANELQVLEDNGCRIRMVKNKLAIRHKPVPQLLLANGIYETEKVNPFINFDVLAPNLPPQHYGVTGFITQTFGGASVTQQGYDVFCKLTFQLKDPR